MNQELLKACLRYDPDTGIFFWLKSAGRLPAGSYAGSPTADGYLQITVGGKNFKAHRLAWLYIYGSFPSGNLDHINRRKMDNRIDNLRLATRAQNMRNVARSATKKSGLPKGVTWAAKGRKHFRATVYVAGRAIYVGVFDSEQDAHKAYCDEAKKHFGEYFCAG